MQLKIKVKIPHNDQFSASPSQCSRKLGSWKKQHNNNIVSEIFWCFLTGRWPINKKEMHPFMVAGKGHVCSLKTGVMERKGSSSGDMLQGGVLHNESNMPLPLPVAPPEMRGKERTV